MFYYAPKMLYYAPKILYYASICYYAFKVYYAQNYASRIRQGLISLFLYRHAFSRPSAIHFIHNVVVSVFFSAQKWYRLFMLCIGGGTRGAGGATAPPDFKIYAFGPPQISKPEINQHRLEITFKHALQFLKYNLHES